MTIKHGGRGFGHTSRWTSAAVAVSAALPSGALGYWNPADYTTSPRANIPNQIAATEPDGNLFGSGRRLLGTFYTAPGGTLTDNAVTGPLGLTDAATLVGIGNWLLWPVYDYTLSAGTYTFAVDAKRNTGTDQVFAFSKDYTSTKSATKTATSSWQSFNYTFTLASPTSIRNIVICSINGATDANLQISNPRLFSGSSDLGAPVFAGHIFPGKSGIDSSFAVTSGVLDLTASQATGLIQFNTDVSLAGGFTVQMVVNKTTGSVGWEGGLSKIQDFTTWAALFNISSGAPMPSAYAAASPFNTTPVVASSKQQEGLWNFLSHGWHIFTWRHDGTKEELFLDDVRMFTNYAAMNAVSVADLWINTVVNPTLSNGRKYGPMAMWDRALSDVEVMAGYNYLKAQAALSSITIDGDTTDRVLVAEGDSITGSNIQTYAYQAGPNLSPWAPGSVFATNGASLATITSRAPYVDRVLANGVNGRKIILSVLIGAADLETWPGASDAIAMADYLASVAAYCDARRSAGFKVVVCTILPKGGYATYNARRAIFNAGVTGSWVGVHCDAIADFAADATMGPDDSFTTNPTKWTDYLHPSVAGHTVLEAIYRAAVNSI